MQIDTQKNMNIILLHPSRQCVYLEKSSCVLSVQGYGGALCHSYPCLADSGITKYWAPVFVLHGRHSCSLRGRKYKDNKPRRNNFELFMGQCGRISFLSVLQVFKWYYKFRLHMRWSGSGYSWNVVIVVIIGDWDWSKSKECLIEIEDFLRHMLTLRIKMSCRPIKR